jgi:formylglycine-generating enzyme required for sulfatase activity
MILGYRVFYALTINDNANDVQTAEPIDSEKTEQSLAKNPKEKQPVVHVTTNAPEAVKPAKGLLEPAMKRLPSGIAMGIYEVTQAEWRSVMGNNPSSFKACDTCPVENVSWNDVQDFIKKLNARSGKHYRLPTEDEWFAACQAGQSTTYCGSDSIDDVAAWYSENSEYKTHPVGRKSPNHWGLYDMSGNVKEWTDSCYDGDCPRLVLRGGSWVILPGNLRSAYRDGAAFAADYRDNDVGFRLAQD